MGVFFPVTVGVKTTVHRTFFSVTIGAYSMKSAPKTCQLDPISTPLLVKCPDTLLPFLTALVNSSLSCAQLLLFLS